MLHDIAGYGIDSDLFAMWSLHDAHEPLLSSHTSRKSVSSQVQFQYYSSYSEVQMQ